MLLRELYAELDIPTAVRQHMYDTLNERNFNNNFTDGSSELANYIITSDFSTINDIKEKLRDYENQAPEFKASVA